MFVYLHFHTRRPLTPKDMIVKNMNVKYNK